MEPDEKEAAGAGVFAAVFIVVVALLVILGWGPVSFVLDKWNGYWDGLKTKPEVTAIAPDGDYARALNAKEACIGRARAYFGNEYFSVYASSTDEYKTYECVGVKTNKIP